MRTEYDDVIRAWLNGAEVEEMHEGKWYPFAGDWVAGRQYRIAKPAKEPKYLYVYAKEIGVVDKHQLLGEVHLSPVERNDAGVLLGKIRLEE
jgi:hypothetical protein